MLHRSRPTKTKDQILGEVRAIEDGLNGLIERFQGGALAHQSMVFGLQEIRWKLMRLTEVEDA